MAQRKLQKLSGKRGLMRSSRTGRCPVRPCAPLVGTVSSMAMAQPVGSPLLAPRKFAWVNIISHPHGGEEVTVLFCPGSRQNVSEVKEMFLGKG